MHELGTLFITRPLQRFVRCALVGAKSDVLPHCAESAHYSDEDCGANPTADKCDRDRIVVVAILRKVHTRLVSGGDAGRIVNKSCVRDARDPRGSNRHEASEQRAPRPRQLKQQDGEPVREQSRSGLGDFEDDFGSQART